MTEKALVDKSPSGTFSLLLGRAYPIYATMLSGTLIQWLQLWLVKHYSESQSVSLFAFVSQIIFLFDCLTTGFYLVEQRRFANSQPLSQDSESHAKSMAMVFGLTAMLFSFGAGLALGKQSFPSLLLCSLAVAATVFFSTLSIPLSIQLLELKRNRFYTLSGIFSQLVGAAVTIFLAVKCSRYSDFVYLFPMVGSLCGSALIFTSRKIESSLNSEKENPSHYLNSTPVLTHLSDAWNKTLKPTLVAAVDRMSLSFAWIGLYFYCSKYAPSVGEDLSVFSRGSLPVTFFSIALGISTVALTKGTEVDRHTVAQKHSNTAYVLYLCLLITYACVAFLVWTFFFSQPPQIAFALYSCYLFAEGFCNINSRTLIGLEKSWISVFCTLTYLACVLLALAICSQFSLDFIQIMLIWLGAKIVHASLLFIQIKRLGMQNQTQLQTEFDFAERK
jgi:hypothetical protein